MTLRSLFRRRQVDREIDEELRFHLERRTEENVAAGMAPDAAAREARRAFGNVQTVREECRDARVLRRHRTLREQLGRRAGRQYRRHRRS